MARATARPSGHDRGAAPADGLAETSQGMERVTVAVAPQAHRRKTELSAPPAGPPAPRRRASPSPPRKACVMIRAHRPTRPSCCSRSTSCGRPATATSASRDLRQGHENGERAIRIRRHVYSHVEYVLSGPCGAGPSALPSLPPRGQGGLGR